MFRPAVVRISFVLIALLGLAPGISSAQVPRRMSYEAILQIGGTPVPDATYTVTFKYYAAASGGALQGQDALTTITTTNGACSATLNPSGLVIFTQPLWLELTLVGGPTGGGFPSYPYTFSPRTELTAAPYAFLTEGLRSPIAGGARILSEQGNLPSRPAIGFFSTNGVDDGGGGNGIYRPLANTMAFSTGNTERMRITSGGAVGIGVTSPAAGLHVRSTGTGLIVDAAHTADYGYGMMSRVSRDLTKGFSVYNSTTNQENFLVYGDGRVFAREITVTLASPFPDYVFAPSYRPMPLAELGAYVRDHRHLPGIPTASDAAAGVPLGELCTSLLAKVEELTLHVIELDRSNQALRTQLLALGETRRRAEAKSEPAAASATEAPR